MICVSPEIVCLNRLPRTTALEPPYHWIMSVWLPDPSEMMFRKVLPMTLTGALVASRTPSEPPPWKSELRMVSPPP